MHALIVFNIRTRRYEIARQLVEQFFLQSANDPYAPYIQKEAEDLGKRMSGILKEYVPQGDNADVYFRFLESIGFTEGEGGVGTNTFVRPRRMPKPIPREDYPAPKTAEGTRFVNFVVFDVETTGLDPVKDSIIELSAVKVKNGKIVDRFSRLVRPIDKKVPDMVENITGITHTQVAKAEEIWQVFPEFVKFIGNDVLVGYNNLAFDSKFLVRAGRYSNIVMENPHFDVMNYALTFKKQLGIDHRVSLVDLGKRLQIENPQAHRALADAETTANVYLKLLSMEEYK